jgi:hypothetical protein
MKLQHATTQVIPIDILLNPRSQVPKTHNILVNLFQAQIQALRKTHLSEQWMSLG